MLQICTAIGGDYNPFSVSTFFVCVILLLNHSIPAGGAEFLLAASVPVPDAERRTRVRLVVVQGEGARDWPVHSSASRAMTLEAFSLNCMYEFVHFFFLNALGRKFFFLFERFCAPHRASANSRACSSPPGALSICGLAPRTLVNLYFLSAGLEKVSASVVGDGGSW